MGLLWLCWELCSRGFAWTWWDICWAKWLIVIAMWDKIRISVVQAGRAGVMALFLSGSCLINIAGRAWCSSLSNVVFMLRTALREVLLSFKFPWSRSGWWSLVRSGLHRLKWWRVLHPNNDKINLVRSGILLTERAVNTTIMVRFQNLF